MAAKTEETVLELDGREVRITSPDKVFFPERGETKLDLVRYYEAVREPLMATMGGRPVLLQRFPEGAGGTNFFQKRVPKDAPDWLQTTRAKAEIRKAWRAMQPLIDWLDKYVGASDRPGDMAVARSLTAVEESPRCRESHVSSAPFSSAMRANVCRSE